MHIRITSWTMLSFTGGRLGKVEEGERQGEKEKNCLTSHLEQADLWDEQYIWIGSIDGGEKKKNSFTPRDSKRKNLESSDLILIVIVCNTKICSGQENVLFTS